MEIKRGDCVWYNDFLHQVIKVKGGSALIREISSVAESPDLDEWVAISEIELDMDDDEDDDRD